MENNEKLIANFIGELKIGDYTVPCAVLSNEDRVVFQREFVGLLTGNKKGGLDRYLRAKNLQPYLPERFKGESWDQSILRFPIGGVSAHGFKTTPNPAILNFLVKNPKFTCLSSGEQGEG